MEEESNENDIDSNSFNEVKRSAPIPGVRGNWQCPSCRNVNFPRRAVCNRCSAPKPISAYDNYPPMVFSPPLPPSIMYDMSIAQWNTRVNVLASQYVSCFSHEPDPIDAAISHLIMMKSCVPISPLSYSPLQYSNTAPIVVIPPPPAYTLTSPAARTDNQNDTSLSNEDIKMAKDQVTGEISLNSLNMNNDISNKDAGKIKSDSPSSVSVNPLNNNTSNNTGKNESDSPPSSPLLNMKDRSSNSEVKTKSDKFSPSSPSLKPLNVNDRNNNEGEVKSGSPSSLSLKPLE